MTYQAEDHFVQDRTEAPPVDGSIVRLLLNYFRSKILQQIEASAWVNWSSFNVYFINKWQEHVTIYSSRKGNRKSNRYVHVIQVCANCKSYRYVQVGRDTRENFHRYCLPLACRRRSSLSTLPWFLPCTGRSRSEQRDPEIIKATN